MELMGSELLKKPTLLSVGRRYENMGGPALEDFDWLELLVTPNCIESGKIGGGGHAGM